jgi:threonine dehydratase
MFGRSFVEIIIYGDTFDDSYQKALAVSRIDKSVFIHPFDDVKVISGQGTTAIEVFKQYPKVPDYVFVPIGGGGFASGVSIMLKHYYPNVKIIGVEPQGAPSMSHSLKMGKNVGLETIDGFVDGAAVKRVGDLAFDICSKWLDDVVIVPEGKVCSTILSLYNEEAIVVEPAGALSVAALDFYKTEIKDKNVICFISGGNNDITRTEEFRERSMLYEGLKHYFIIRFPQRAGALREFLVEVLGVNDDITHFEYVKKNNRDAGPAVIGIELKNKNDFEGLIQRLDSRKINYQYLNNNSDYLQYLI